MAQVHSVLVRAGREPCAVTGRLAAPWLRRHVAGYSAFRSNMVPRARLPCRCGSGRWIVIRDGRVVATPGKAGRVYDRELIAGGRKYWVAPPGAVRPRIP